MTKLATLNQVLVDFYANQPLADRLNQAITYSLEAGGKRIRPLMLLEVLEGFGVSLLPVHYQVAATVELIHTGSLIHDDLPAMDDDDYRRGQLTNHKKFDEATAILAGDSLFLDPFGFLATCDLPETVRLSLISELAQASGTWGMVGGQMLDMLGEKQELSLDALRTIHAHKTGKLLVFPFVAAGIIAEQAADVVADLRTAGELVGLAFQVRDDILDITASFEELGKTPKKDLSSQKATYPSLLGLEQSYDLLNDCLNQASAIFQKLKEQANFDPSRVDEMIERLRLNA